MDHFYDGQVRRYLTQLVRMFSGFQYADSKNQKVTVPVMYGDITRQVGSILRDNSENKIPSAPRMGVYVSGLEMDRSRTSDSSYINKVNIRDLSSGVYMMKLSDGDNESIHRIIKD